MLSLFLLLINLYHMKNGKIFNILIRHLLFYFFYFILIFNNYVKSNKFISYEKWKNF